MSPLSSLIQTLPPRAAILRAHNTQSCVAGHAEFVFDARDESCGLRVMRMHGDGEAEGGWGGVGDLAPVLAAI